MKEKLKGTGVALITPFTAKGEVDFDQLQKMVDYVIADGKGVEYIVCLGTTGESVTLTKEEKLEVFQCIRLHNKKRVALVAGIGGNNTAEVLKNISHFNFEGFDAILSVSPYYNKPSQQGIFEHYKAINELSPVPVIVYNVPGRTASNITAETSLRMASELKNIAAIKEASGDLNQCMKLVKHAPQNFAVLSGDDMLTVPMISFGMTGVISVLANAFPVHFSEMIRQSLAGNFNQAQKMLLPLIELDNLMYAESNPVGVKTLLHLLGVCKPHVRLPLVSGSEKLQKDISAALKESGIPR